MTSKYEEIMKTKNFLPYKMGYLTPKQVQKAKEELKETDENRGPSIDQLRKCVLSEKKLKCPTDDAYLLQFLRARKFDVKKAFTLLQNKYQVRKSYSELYDDLDMDGIRRTLAAGPVYYLPYRDEDGCVVFVIKLSNWDPDEANICTGMLVLTAVLLQLIDDPATQVCGVRVLVDVRGFSVKQMRCITPRYIHLLSRALRNCLPIRFKGIHFYNESTIFQYIWSILKLFLSDKIRNRAHFHGDNQKSLQKLIPKEILTTEYGGDNPGLNSTELCLSEMEKFHEKLATILSSGYM